MALKMESLRKLKPHELHKLVMSNLMAKKKSNHRTDLDVIRENHKFLWDEEEDSTNSSWEETLAKKYYSKLFKEYCICDLTRYKENKIAMRWRIEQEVVAGKGQFICGNKACSKKEALKSWEVNFNYLEHGEKKNALVKLRLCEKCSNKLNYHTKKRLAKRKPRSSIKRVSSGKNKIDKAEEELIPGESSKDDQQNDESLELNADLPAIENKESSESLWSSKAPVEERSREEEFGDYLEDLLL